jgi:hypothetical protein
MFAFILAKFETKPKQKEFALPILERNGILACIPEKIGTNQSKRNFLYEFQSKMARFVLFQQHPRKQINSLFKKRKVDIANCC